MKNDNSDIKQQISQLDDLVVLTGTAVTEIHIEIKKLRHKKSPQNHHHVSGLHLQSCDQERKMPTYIFYENMEQNINVNVNEPILGKPQRNLDMNEQDIGKKLILIRNINLLSMATFTLLLLVIVLDLGSGTFCKMNVINLILLGFTIIIRLFVAFDSIYISLKSNCSCFPIKTRWKYGIH